ncbi:hypothetical protein DLAC_07958 [Tieghemostelium lacteum]|uniref:Ubiquitin-like domain-containing protein n=1 Tax=Tieghemostelium lacteum TaxID=361077 RepID=A0A151ZAV0_TIELA|nr:hypothetical protein DLAC_07958 [Tieghemostelium lacteum]|eukprot:KYQ91056.1 hypothetical protein DLAC_07958 [Tieghemostelium lacteum]
MENPTFLYQNEMEIRNYKNNKRSFEDSKIIILDAQHQQAVEEPARKKMLLDESDSDTSPPISSPIENIIMSEEEKDKTILTLKNEIQTSRELVTSSHRISSEAMKKIKLLEHQIKIQNHTLDDFRDTFAIVTKAAASKKIILNQDDSCGMIEMKLLTNFNYTPILDTLLRKSSSSIYKGQFGIQLIKEYNRFLTLKVLTKDIDGNKLTPPPLIDEIWHQHILDTKRYQELSSLIGYTLHTNPNLEFESLESRRTRYQNTMRIYLHYFQVFGSTIIWELNYLQSNSNVNRGSTPPIPNPTIQKQIVQELQDRVVSDSKDATPHQKPQQELIPEPPILNTEITIKINDNGRISAIKVDRINPILQQLKCFGIGYLKNIYYKGIQILHNDTVNSLDIMDGSYFNVK